MPHYFAKIIFWKIFLQKYFFQKCFANWKIFLEFFAKIFLWQYFLWKYFSENIFWSFWEFFFRNIFGVLAKIFLWKYFWLKYFWWKYFGENIFWSFFDHQGFPFSHQISTPSFTSFWSEVWQTYGRNECSFYCIRWQTLIKLEYCMFLSLTTESRGCPRRISSDPGWSWVQEQPLFSPG